MTPRFDGYVDKIRSLPANPTDNDVVTSDFLLGEEGRIEVYYAPLHGVTTSAKIVIVGITPGVAQMRAAFTEARRLLHEGITSSRKSVAGWHSRDPCGRISSTCSTRPVRRIVLNLPVLLSYSTTPRTFYTPRPRSGIQYSTEGRTIRGPIRQFTDRHYSSLSLPPLCCRNSIKCPMR